MDIVVDSSTIIAVVANEPEKGKLIELTRGANLIAPQSIHWEIGHAFSAMLRRRRITVDQALSAVRLYRKIPIRFVAIEMEDALRIANALGVYACDAYLIQCALKYRAPLLSLDQQLVEGAKKMAAGVMEVTT